MYVADNKGVVYELSLKPHFKSDEQSQWNVSRDATVQALSVDWLFDRLYLVLEMANESTWKISRSKLDGRELTHLVTGLYSKPLHIEADPYNG